MAWISGRLDRLRQLVAYCVKLNLTPSKTGFADFIIHKSSTFGVSVGTSKGYITTLVEAWHHNQWKSYIENNNYLTKEEQTKWIQTHLKKN